jgi:hypothetical protein
LSFKQQNQLGGLDAHSPPQRLCMGKMSSTNSAFFWLLIWLVSTYSLVATDFWSQVSVLDRFWMDWVYRCLVRFLGHKMGETYCGQNIKSGGNKHIFLMPTQTHVFDNCSNSYDRLSTTHLRCSAVAENQNNKWFGGLATDSDSIYYIFYSCLLDLLIKWLDDATRPNRPHQKKRNDPLLRIVRIRWHNALKHRR